MLHGARAPLQHVQGLLQLERGIPGGSFQPFQISQNDRQWRAQIVADVFNLLLELLLPLLIGHPLPADLLQSAIDGFHQPLQPFVRQGEMEDLVPEQITLNLRKLPGRLLQGMFKREIPKSKICRSNYKEYQSQILYPKKISHLHPPKSASALNVLFPQ